LQRRWRAWVSSRITDRWLTNGRYYQLNLVPGDHANPEYRIADDVRIATESPVDFVSGVAQAFLSAATFIVVLWTIGGALDVSVGGLQIHVPGFLVIAALLYALLASGAMVLIGSQFVQASENKNQAEAEYRYVITRLRENGESIALIRGEEEERAGLRRALSKVLSAWRHIAFQNMKTTSVSQTSGFIAPVLPIILCAPKFLDGSMSLGEVMQAASAFTIVQGAFNWLVDNYPKLADWTASARRVAALMVALDALQAAEEGDGVGRIAISDEGGEPALRLQDLSVRLNDGTAVLDDADITIMPGERVLIAGESGTGKDLSVAATSLCAHRHPAARRHLPRRPRQPRHRGRRRRLQARRPRAPRRQIGRGGALGPNPLRRREAAPGLLAHPAPQPRHRGARRGDRGSRSQESGQADGAPARSARHDAAQRRSPPGAGGVPYPQDRAGAQARRGQARA
jgi:putative ATP-binding cassette transporter